MPKAFVASGAGSRRETAPVDRRQLNLRVPDEVLAAIDQKRIALAPKLRHIPTRSEVVRLALEHYLGIRIDPAWDGRTVAARQRKAARG